MAPPLCDGGRPRVILAPPLCEGGGWEGVNSGSFPEISQRVFMKNETEKEFGGWMAKYKRNFVLERRRDMPEQKKQSSDASLKRFMSRAEAVTLAGMVITVFSLFLTWRISGPPASIASQAALVKFEIPETGFMLGLQWILLTGAVLSSAGLLFPINAKNRLRIACIQGAGGLLCFLVALRYLAPLPGVALGVLGGAMLVFGAADRFSVSQEPDAAAPR